MKCGIGTLPEKSFLAGLMDSSWGGIRDVPITINWTTGQKSILDGISAGAEYYGDVKGNGGIRLKQGTEHLVVSPDQKTTRVIADALESWSDALGRKIKFNYVEELPENKGIAFTAPASTSEFLSNGFMAVENKNIIGNKIDHAVILLPNDIFHLTKNNPGLEEYFKETITHEIGHALGIGNEHPHEVTILNKLILLAKRPAYCSVMDDNYMIPNSQYRECVDNTGNGLKCSQQVNNTVPGEVDIAIINAGMEFPENFRKPATASVVNTWDGVALSYLSGFSFGVAKASLAKGLEYSGASQRTSALVSGLSEAVWLLGTTALSTGNLGATVAVGATIFLEKAGYVQPQTSNNIAIGFGVGIANGSNSFTNSVLKTGASWVGKLAGEFVTKKSFDTLASATGMQR